MDVKSSVIIPLIMASLFIVGLLAMNHAWSPKYAASMQHFEPIEGAFFRLEGILVRMELQDNTNGSRLAVLCENEYCAQIEIPAMYIPRLKLHDRLIVEGIWQRDRLQTKKVLTRCH